MHMLSQSHRPLPDASVEASQPDFAGTTLLQMAFLSDSNQHDFEQFNQIQLIIIVFGRSLKGCAYDCSYVASTCPYIAPIMREIRTSGSPQAVSIFNRQLTNDIRLAKTTDPAITSSVLQAYSECV